MLTEGEIRLEGVSVRYRLIKEKPNTLQEFRVNYLNGKRCKVEELCALKNISIEVNKGGSLGVIGHNGAGKSTLLKLIAEVIPPSEGKVSVTGKIVPLIELGAGFDHDLTGRENIYLNASILGFSKREIEKRFKRIIDFSELQDFVHTPLKNYSSGMIARLGFSIATEVDPEILIIDEVLSVGDESFRKKSKERILYFKKKGITLLFVSHSMEGIMSLCDRVLWLDHGEMRMLGDSADVIAAYHSQAGRQEPGERIK